MKLSRTKFSCTTDGPAIRLGRVDKGWTQSALAIRAGVSKRTVETAEGSRQINSTSLDAIAGALGREAVELIVHLPQQSPMGTTPTWPQMDVASFHTPGEAMAFARSISEHRAAEPISQAIAIAVSVEENPQLDLRTRAEAAAILSDLYLRRAIFDTGALADTDRALAYAERALQLAPDYWEGHAQYAISVASRHYTWSTAEASIERALELEPRAAQLTHSIATTYGLQGRFAEAEACLRKSLRERLGNPLAIRLQLQQVLHCARDYDGTIAECRLTKALYPSIWNSDVFIALSEHARGSRLRAVSAILDSAWGQREGEMHYMIWRLKQTLREQSTGLRPALNAVRPDGGGGDMGDLFRLAYRGHTEKAAELLLDLYRRRYPMMPFLCWMQIIDPLRALPEIREMFAMMGLPGACDPKAFLQAS